MKTRIIIIALAMLTVASAASAQEAIKKQFERIDNMKGITHVSESKSWTTDSTGLMTGSRVIILRAGEQYFGDLDKLREAFDNDGSWASMTYSYIADHFTDGENGAPRRRFSVHRDGADPIIVGDMKNSTYLIANFDDKEHPGYRRCYAAEWTETDDPDPRPLQLTYVYGRKPQPQTTISRTIRYSGRADWPELERRLEELKLIPDTLLKGETFHLDLGQRLSELRDSLRSAGVYKFDFTMPGDGQPQDIPMTDGDTKQWMQKALSRVTHLSASDWHRFFGILTQKMLDEGKTQSTENMVVAANLILDLCKNADQLDDDERAVAAQRLQSMNSREKIEDEYVRQILQLGYKKLLRK